MKILHLNVKRKWFDLIASGEKRIEYRAYNEYWFSRLVKNAGIVIIMKVFDEIYFKNCMFRNGKPAPFLRITHLNTQVTYTLNPITGKFEDMFLIHLGDIIEIKNWKVNNEKRKM